MDLIKKNIISIICGAIAIAALAAYAWPLGNHKAALQQKVTQQVSLYGTLEGVLKQSRTLPVIPGSPKQGALEGFPSARHIEVARQAIKELGNESASMLTMAVQLNQHKPLLPGCLPECKDTLAYQFRDLYYAFMKPEEGRPHGRVIPDAMVAGIPVTKKEILKTAATIHENMLRGIPINNLGQPDPVEERKAEAKFVAESNTLAERIRRRRAEQCRIYVDPTALDVVSLDTQRNAFRTTAPPPGSIWTAQVELWIQQDVLQAIQQANSGAQNVLDAPVKRLLKLAINPNYVLPPKEEPAPAGDAGAPGPAAAGRPPDKGVASPAPTGRSCNGFYDVLQFTLYVHVEASKLPLLIQCLEQGRFVTVYSVEVASVDAGQMALDGYMYGNAPVAHVTLRCEALFLRQWTGPLMPAVVKQHLGIAN